MAQTADLLARIEAAAARSSSGRLASSPSWRCVSKQPSTRQRAGGDRARHRRELRRHRTDELRSGLAAIAATYRDALVDGTAPHDEAVIDAVHRINATLESFEHNPNETLMLQSLWSLPVLSLP